MIGGHAGGVKRAAGFGSTSTLGCAVLEAHNCSPAFATIAKPAQRRVAVPLKSNRNEVPWGIP
jgi:hypothetical protein